MVGTDTTRQGRPEAAVIADGCLFAPAIRGRIAGRMAALAAAIGVLAVAAVVLCPPAFADSSAPTLSSVIDSLRNWMMGILAGIATCMLTVAAFRYIWAGGDPSQLQKAKTTLQTALGGYALAVLAPVVITVLKSIVGG